MRDWVVGLVGEGMAPFVTTIVAAAIVILLLLIVIWVARKVLGGTIGPRNKSRGPRLAVMDVAIIDQKRKLVLVRRDEVEHLLLIGGQNDVVVEPGILRVPAAARPQRLEPSLRPEAEAVERAPSTAAIAAPRQPLRAPEPQPAVSPASARPQPSAQPRPPEARGASPLTRAVPRPPVAPTEPTAAPMRSTPVPSVESVTPVAPPPAAEPVAVAPPVISAPRSTMRQEPVMAPQKENETSAMAAAFPDLSVRRAPPQAAEAETPAEAANTLAESAPAVAPPVASPMAAFPTRDHPGADELASDRMVEDRPGQDFQEPARQNFDRSPADRAAVERLSAPIVSIDAAPASVASPMPAGADSFPAPRTGPEPRPTPRQSVGQSILPAPRSPLIPQRVEPSLLATGGQAGPMQRVSISGGSEPVRRPAPPFVPTSPTHRSMATPTYPPRPAAEEDGLDEASEASAEVSPRRDPPTLQADLPPEMAETPATAPAVEARSPLISRGATSPLIAAAERQKEALLARAVPDRKAAELSPELTKPVEPVAPRSVTPPASPFSEKPADEDEAPRPLSVRSFATAIQAMKPSYEPARPPVAPAAAAQPPAHVPAPRVEPSRPLPVFVKQSALVAERTEPVRPVALDDATSLEDFLSAELDSDFGKVSWNDEPVASPTPTVRIDPPVPRDKAPDVRAEPSAPSEAPRILTLEEEMERLLGDFDFEISDRKAK